MQRFLSDLCSAQDQSPALEEVLSGLQVDLLVPYSQLLVSSWSELPDSCLSFGLRSSPTRWLVFSEAEELRGTRTELKHLLQVRGGASCWFIDLGVKNADSSLKE